MIRSYFVGMAMLMATQGFGQGYFVNVQWKSEAGQENLVSNVHSPQIMIEAFSFIGISAYTTHKNTPPLQYRCAVDGQWGMWQNMRAFHEGATGYRSVYEATPVFVPVDSVQFRTEKNKKDWKIRMYIGQHSTNEIEVQPQYSMPCDTPAYCNRACWCDTCLPQSTTPTTPTHLIIHHSAGFTTAPDYKLVMTYYWDFHVNINGWDDIGYNWLIDPNGVIYEGRGSNRLGAHFSCMNSNTLGICMIGNYENQLPTDTAIGSLKALLAYEAYHSNIDPDGMSWHASSQLNLFNISTHRDGNSATAPGACPKGTACPGDSLYALLPTIRSAVNGRPCMQGVGMNAIKRNDPGVYPNPVNDELHWEGAIDEGIVEIYHAQGKVVFYSNHPVKVVGVLGWPAGVYYVKTAGEKILRIVKM